MQQMSVCRMLRVKRANRYSRALLVWVLVWAALAWGGYGGRVLAASTLSVSSEPTQAALIELFTSEGCSSCPPADAWLNRLARVKSKALKVVPLAFHVDYWNYIGWPDPYSSKANTRRQRKRAATSGRQTIYTPEFMVDGRETRGSKRILKAVQSANSAKADARITLNVAHLSDSLIEARIAIDQVAPRLATSTLVALFENNIVRKIGAGENRGKTLRYNYVVRSWTNTTTPARKAYNISKRIAIPKDSQPQNLGLAVVVIDKKSGATLQAVSTSLAALF